MRAKPTLRSKATDARSPSSWISEYDVEYTLEKHVELLGQSFAPARQSILFDSLHLIYKSKSRADAARSHKAIVTFGHLMQSRRKARARLKTNLFVEILLLLVFLAN